MIVNASDGEYFSQEQVTAEWNKSELTDQC